MRTYELLSIDESGKASYKHPSLVFVVSGVVIPEKLKPKIDKRMRKLKKKYFNNEDIVFHSRDMARGKGQFTVLQNGKVERKFWGEFIRIIKRSEISLLLVIADKNKLKNKGWQTQTILQRIYLQLVENFVQHLKKTNNNGKIILESDSYQDAFFIYAHSRLQSAGLRNKKISGKEYRSMITSLSLVNKENLDIDVQIADVLAPIAGLKYHMDILKSEKTLTEVNKMKMELLEEKLANKENPSTFEVLS